MAKISQTFAAPSLAAWSPDASSVRTASVRPAALTPPDTDSRTRALEGLSTLSTVASGIAHEVNNPLAYVLTNLDFVREQLGDRCSADVLAALEEARLGALRIGAIVRNLQVVVADEKRAADIDLAEIVESACMMVQSELTDGARIARARAWAPRVTANASRVAYLLIKLLSFVSCGTSRLDRSTLRVATGTNDAGNPAVQIEGFCEECDVTAIEEALEARGLQALATALGAELTADYRAGAISLEVAFPAAARSSVG